MSHNNTLAIIEAKKRMKPFRTDEIQMQHISIGWEASRIKALIETVRHFMQTYPGEKIIIFSCFLHFFDIAYHAIKKQFNTICLRYDGTLNSKEKHAVQEGWLLDLL
jgi:hypothetical protein